jgi:hypothetical protein
MQQFCCLQLERPSSRSPETARQPGIIPSGTFLANRFNKSKEVELL